MVFSLPGERGGRAAPGAKIICGPAQRCRPSMVNSPRNQERGDQMRLTGFGFAGIATALFAVPAFAHHTHAMFDFTRTVELKAKVNEFKWTNPHRWRHLMTPKAQGEMVE